MMTNIDVINSVFDILKAAGIGPAIKYGIPGKDLPAEYYIINSLEQQFGQLSITPINVNCHVRDKGKDIPDAEKLNVNSKAVIAALNLYSDANILIYHVALNIIKESSQNEHIINLRFEVETI